jgi:transmembrane 9 superfamily protein 2/4
MAAKLLALALACPAAAFLLPGVAPHDYQPGERVWLKVNSLTSAKTQVPYEYYRVRSFLPPKPPPLDLDETSHASPPAQFNFCKPRKVFAAKENFSEFLSGDRIHNSPYQARRPRPRVAFAARRPTTEPRLATTAAPRARRADAGRVDGVERDDRAAPSQVWRRRRSRRY